MVRAGQVFVYFDDRLIRGLGRCPHRWETIVSKDGGALRRIILLINRKYLLRHGAEHALRDHVAWKDRARIVRVENCSGVDGVAVSIRAQNLAGLQE